LITHHTSSVLDSNNNWSSI